MKARNAPHIKMRKASERNWWEVFTQPLLEFIALSSRTWTEIEAWCKVRQYTDSTMQNMVAWLDLDRKIEIRHAAGAPRHRGDAFWVLREDDGSSECRHARRNCVSCEWTEGFANDDPRRPSRQLPIALEPEPELDEAANA